MRGLGHGLTDKERQIQKDQLKLYQDTLQTQKDIWLERMELDQKQRELDELQAKHQLLLDPDQPTPPPPNPGDLNDPDSPGARGDLCLLLRLPSHWMPPGPISGWPQEYATNNAVFLGIKPTLIEKPANFYEKHNNIQCFLYQYVTYFKTHQIFYEESQQVNYAASLFKGQALAWWVHHIETYLSVTCGQYQYLN
ncbi:hypothetical protein IW262DRAFT_1469037 [Armillaria fumosa]|nr:hypothetical protein IW262DRAFT_1469037 [Armillaria fumosa]